MAYLGWVELKDSKRSDYWSVLSWTNMLKQLDYEADICFFGNSITKGGEWQSYFPDKKVVNLGYSGDQLHRMLMRVEQIKAVNPTKVFLMAGVNDLKYFSMESFTRKYASLVDSINHACPESELYLQSILPVRNVRASGRMNNETIMAVNKQIAKIAESRHLIYIDLYSHFLHGGELKEEYSKDGLHLKKEAYDIWVEKIGGYMLE